MKTSSLPINEQVSREMQIQNYSSRTISTYICSLNRLALYKSKPIEQINVVELKEYLYHLINVEGLSVSTINQYISAYKLLQESVLGKEWDSIKIKRPRRDKKLPIILSEEEILMMINGTKNIKHRAIIALAYSSGMRREEVRELKPNSIDSSRMQIHVKKGKGRKDRYTILSEKTLDLLRIYYKTERPKEFLFEPVNKKGIHYGAETLNKIVKNAASKAKIKKDISFHTLRHCFATHLIEHGVSLPIVQQFMGHSSIKTTTIYLHLANLRPATITSPLDSMNINMP